jgi:protein tyrosine/serine phosphatase
MRIDKPFHRFLAWLHLHLQDHGLIRLLYNNFYEVLPNVYRCSQPSPSQIKRYQRDYGIKTIINLRGENDDTSFWLFEKETCDQLGITMIDHRLFSRDLPSKEALHSTQDLLANVQYPILFHCKSGADRAGLMATLCRIFITGHPVSEAIHELDWYYGHFKFARTGMIDFFFADFLRYQVNNEAPLPFMQWVDEVYDQQALEAEFDSSWLGGVLTDKILRRE